MVYLPAEREIMDDKDDITPRIKAFLKIMDVIGSCKCIEHWRVADRMADQYAIIYSYDERAHLLACSLLEKLETIEH